MEKFLKKLIAIIGLASIMLLSFAGCTRIKHDDIVDTGKDKDAFPAYDGSFALEIDDWDFGAVQTRADTTIVGRIDYAGDYKFDEFLESGADSSDDLLRFLKSQFEQVDVPYSFGDVGCSTFSASLNSGDRVFARNFDFTTFSPAIVLRTPSREGVYATISVCGAAFLGYTSVDKIEPTFDENTSGYLLAPYVPLDGMNEAGVSMAVLALASPAIAQDNGKTDITTTTAIRLVLDYAASVEEAIELLRDYDLHTDGRAYHYQIADASGTSAVVEYTDVGEMIVSYSESYKYCNNHYVNTDKQLQYFIDEDSLRREYILKMTLENNGGKFINEAEAMGLLEDVARANTTVNSGTHWSMIYNLTDRTVKMCLSAKYSVVYDFSLAEDK